MKKDNPTKQAGSYIGQGSSLKPLLEKVNQLKLLNDLFLPFLEPAKRDYCQVANIVGDKLVVMTANASVATQLRLEARDLLTKIQADPSLKFVKEIQYKVTPHQAVSRRRIVKPRQSPERLSEETAEMMREFASSLEDDNLRLVMEKIAKNTK